MSDDEGCFACGAVRLEPFGAYTIQAAHEKELGRMREALRAAEKRELEALAELDEAKAAIRLVLEADCLKSHAFERGDDDASVYELLKSVVRKT